MRAVIQRVKNANVKIDEKIIGEINEGLLVYLGFTEGDNEEDFSYMENKILNLRIFSDDEGKMNLSCKDIGGELLLVSQFTLYADGRKGRRPSFSNALGGDEARKLYDDFVERMKKSIKVETGEFGGDMKVSSINDGPVTILLDSSKLF